VDESSQRRHLFTERSDGAVRTSKLLGQLVNAPPLDYEGIV